MALPISLPIERVHLEVTNQCNFDCAFCPDHKMQRPRGRMTTEQARQLLEEMASHGLAREVRLHLMGEPFLHPHLFEIIEAGAELGLHLSLTTNASLLAPRTIQGLLASRLGELVVSLQTPSRQSFAIRYPPPKLTYEVFRKKVLALLEAALAAKMPFPINLNFLNTTRRGLIGPLREPIDSLSGDQPTREALGLWAREVYALTGDTGDLPKVLTHLDRISVARWETLEVYPRIFFEVRPLFDWGNAWTPPGELRPARYGTCNAVYGQLGILYNGDVVLCCADYDGSTTVGNALEEGLVEVLKKPEVASIVEGFRRNRVVHPRCQQCLGGATRTAALARQLGSILFFKGPGRHFQRTTRLY
ncbi:MAG: radical SAM/SPASM domain-containing protein [Vulcanimicrobiota bacterium]